jgi:O-antigen ligase
MTERVPAASAAVVSGGIVLLAAGGLAFLLSPRLGALALAVPVGLIVWTSPALGAAFLLFVLPLEELAALTPDGLLTLHKLLGVAVFGAWLVRALVQREEVRLPPGMLPLGLLVAWGATSTLWAVDPRIALQTTITAVQLLALYVLIANVLDTPATLRRALGAHVAGGVVLSVAALWLMHEGILQRGRAAIVVDQQLLVQPNALAAVLILPVTITLVGALDRGREGFARLALAAAGALCLTAVMLTMSRGALFALAAVVAVVSAARGAWLLLVGLALALPGAWLAGPELAQRLAEGATFADRGAGRLDIWQVGWVVIRDNPFFGVGLGCFQLVYYDYLSQATGISWAHVMGVLHTLQKASHNAYLGTTAELGVIGLALFGWALAAHLRDAVVAWRALDRRRHPSADVMLVAVAALVACIILAFASDIENRKFLWLAFGMAAIGRLHAARTVRAPAPLRRAA